MGLHATNPGRKIAGEIGPEAASQTIGDGIARCGTFHILIVEDNDADALEVRRILERSRFGGASVRIVNDQQSALKAAREQEFDLVISDFWLGNKTSISLINEISQRSPHLPVIMLSSHSRAGLGPDESSESLVYLSKSNLSPRLLEASIVAAMSAPAEPQES